MTELPNYADLPPAPRGGRSAWGMFGAGDNLGLVNLMTPERIAAAARLVRRGQVFCLDMPIGSISPALATFRGPPRHRVLHEPGTAGFNDVYDNFYPQASSQWDSLAHIGYAPDQMYNGATEQEVLAGTRNTIEHWARHGLAVPRRPAGRRAGDAGRRAWTHTEAVCDIPVNSHVGGHRLGHLGSRSALASILAGIAITVGLILVIVPGLYLITIWAVIVPVIVIEGSGALASFGRSYQLVRGRGWHVFGTLVLVFVILLVVQFLLGLVFLALPHVWRSGLELSHRRGRIPGRALLAGA